MPRIHCRTAPRDPGVRHAARCSGSCDPLPIRQIAPLNITIARPAAPCNRGSFFVVEVTLAK
jgi:hypothetical protein